MRTNKIKKQRYLEKANRKTAKGITLIALIITIIVLLILAGISIATLTGENGILTQANKAKEETIIAREKEGISIALTEYMSKIITAETNEEIDGLEEIMIANGNDVTAEYSYEYDGYLITYNDTGNMYIAYFDYEDGQIKIKENGKIEMGEFVDGAVTGDVIILEKENGEVILIDNLYTTGEINIDSSEYLLITTSGIKQTSGEFMIDRDGKLYNPNTGICLTDIEGSALAGKKVIKINAYKNSLIAIDEEGKLYSYGDNYYGQLGNGTAEDITTPICISDITNSPLNGKNIVDIYNSHANVIAKDSEGKLYSWGYNAYGELGKGTTGRSNMPICISDITNSPLNGKNIVDVYSDGDTVIAKDSEGKIYSWGKNYDGKLGNGTTKNSYMPVCISDITNSPIYGKRIAEIFIEFRIVIVRDMDGKLYSWGNNQYGEFGDGTTESSSIPVCISDIDNSPLNGKNIVYVNNRGSSVVAKDSEGKLYSWQSGMPTCISGYNSTIRATIVDVCENPVRVYLKDSEGDLYTWNFYNNEMRIYRAYYIYEDLKIKEVKKISVGDSSLWHTTLVLTKNKKAYYSREKQLS